MRPCLPAVALLVLLALGCRPDPEPVPPRAAAPRTAAGDSAPASGGSMSSPSLRDVLERHTPELLALPGVTGTGEGVEGGEAVVVVFVLEKTPELARRIPRRIEGHPVILRETGEVRPLRP